MASNKELQAQLAEAQNIIAAKEEALIAKDAEIIKLQNGKNGVEKKNPKAVLLAKTVRELRKFTQKKLTDKMVVTAKAENDKSKFTEKSIKREVECSLQVLREFGILQKTGDDYQLMLIVDSVTVDEVVEMERAVNE